MGFGQSEVASWKRLSASGIVGDSGKAIDIVGYTINSGATAGNIFLMNGTVQTSPFAWSDQARAVSTEQSITIAYPVRLSLGCYVSFDSNVTAATIYYRQASST
jgi:hypothetical protein